MRGAQPRERRMIWPPTHLLAGPAVVRPRHSPAQAVVEDPARGAPEVRAHGGVEEEEGVVVVG
jgi:hypothetical protein